MPVGYSESIFQPLGTALGLRLLTPYSFAKAIAEGTDVSAADKQTVDSQAQNHQIKVWVYNSQNATPDVQRVNQLARSAGIPITTITETLSPATASFQQWQVAELTTLAGALHQATGDDVRTHNTANGPVARGCSSADHGQRGRWPRGAVDGRRNAGPRPNDLA